MCYKEKSESSKFRQCKCVNECGKKAGVSEVNGGKSIVLFFTAYVFNHRKVYLGSKENMNEF